MAGSIQEGDGLAVHLDLVSADVLGDAAGLTGSDGSVADGIQQGGLAVVDVAHDHDDGSAGLELVGGILVGVDELFLDGDHHFLLHLAAHLFCDDGGGVEVDDLAQGGHDAVFHQALDHLCTGLLHAACQLADGDLIGDLDLDGSLLGDLQLELAHLLGLVLAALVGHGSALALVIVAELLLAAALLHPLAPGAAQVFQTLIVLGKVHVAALAGIHDLLLRNAGGGSSGRLRLLSLLGLGALLLCGAAALLLSRTVVVALGSGLGALGGRLGCGLGLLLLLGSGIGIDGLDAGDLVVHGHIVKNDGQLLVGQHLHMVLGGGHILAQNIHDRSGGDIQVLCHLVDSVFLVTQ